MRENPIKPVDRAVWWTEHVIKYGADHLQSPARGLTFVEYYEVKLVFIIMSILFLILALLAFIIKKVLNYILQLYRTYSKLKTY